MTLPNSDPNYRTHCLIRTLLEEHVPNPLEDIDADVKDDYGHLSCGKPRTMTMYLDTLIDDIEELIDHDANEAIDLAQTQSRIVLDRDDIAAIFHLKDSYDDIYNEFRQLADPETLETGIKALKKASTFYSYNRNNATHELTMVYREIKKQTNRDKQSRGRPLGQQDDPRNHVADFAAAAEHYKNPQPTISEPMQKLIEVKLQLEEQRNFYSAASSILKTIITRTEKIRDLSGQPKLVNIPGSHLSLVLPS